MRHYFAYHNALDQGYSSTTITEPHVRTSRNVTGLEGVTVWLIAGEGKSPKSYFIAAKFIADKCLLNQYPEEEELKNGISGKGTLYKLAKPITGTPLIALIKRKTANFIGFQEITDIKIIDGLMNRII